MRRLVAVFLALGLAGCAVPQATSVTAPRYSPLREALAYFPAEAPVVAVVGTDVQDPGLRRAAGGGVFAPAARWLAAAGLGLRDLRPVLGNPAAIGQPHPAAAPVAVLATHDPGALAALASERVASGAARSAGRYRDAELFDEIGWAFAVRDRVLIVSRGVEDLTDALDQRARDDGFDAARLNEALPPATPPAVFARAYVDLSAFVAAGGATARAVPLLGALEDAGVSIGATAEGLRAIAAIDVPGATYDDLPDLAPASGTRPALPRRAPGLAVADLAPLLVAAERAVREALPVSALRIDALRSRLRAAKVDLVPALLAGPATVEPGPVVRLQPERPGVLEDALERAVRRLRLRPAGAGLHRFRGMTLGFAGGAFVAGRAPAARLLRVARRPLVALSSPFLLRLPRLHDAFPRPLEITLGGGPDRLTLYAAAPF